MLANVNTNLLLVLLIVAVVAVTAIIIGSFVFAIVKIRKSNSYVLKMVVWSIVSMIITALSWVFNMGWLRFFMTFLLIPVIHGIVFFITNITSVKYVDKSQQVKKLNILFFLTYLLTYLFFPDGGDVGEMYFFFGLIHSNILSYIAYYISFTAFVVHIIAFIMRIIEIKKTKKSMTDNH